MSAIPCSWCGLPASRVYPGLRPTGVVWREFFLTEETYTDLSLCPDGDGLVRSGERALPDNISAFSVPAREDRR